MATTGTHLILFSGDKSPDEVDGVSTSWTLPMIDIGERDYYLAKDSDEAGNAASERYRDMDRSEFREFIGDERLISWGLGESDEFGIRSLADFVEAVGRVPEEELASYDGNELDAMINLPLAEECDITGEATFRADLLAQSIGIGDIEIPECLRADNPGLVSDWREMDDSTAAEWARILGLAEGSDADDGSIGEILDTFRFVECVAYRHN